MSGFFPIANIIAIEILTFLYFLLVFSVFLIQYNLFICFKNYKILSLHVFSENSAIFSSLSNTTFTGVFLL